MMEVSILGDDVFVMRNAVGTRNASTQSKVYAPLIYCALHPEDTEAVAFWTQRFSLWPMWMIAIRDANVSNFPPTRSQTSIFFNKRGSRKCPHYTAKFQERILEGAGIQYQVDACIQASVQVASPV